MIDINLIPGEEHFTYCLQRNLTFTLGNKTIKKGKLLIFKRVHYCMQFILANSKNSKETLEVPIPFDAEFHMKENLFYFDYRLKTLASNNKEIEKRLRQITVKDVAPSQYYDKILEVTIS
jgi:hypothetical protein